MPAATAIEPAFKYNRLSSDPDESHQKVLALMPASGRVLEVGAAIGYMARALRDRGLDVTATEVDGAAVVQAAAQGVTIRHGLVEDVLSAPEWHSFDVVVAADVIEHVVDGAAMLETLRRCLRPGGHLVLSVPNVAHWTVRLNLARGLFEYTQTGLMDETHLRWYTRASLRRFLEMRNSPSSMRTSP